MPGMSAPLAMRSLTGRRVQSRRTLRRRQDGCSESDRSGAKLGMSDEQQTPVHQRDRPLHGGDVLRLCCER